MEFLWYYETMAASVVLLVVLMTLWDYSPWKCRFDGSSLLFCTPWFGFWLAHEGYDYATKELWTGIKTWTRIPGTHGAPQGTKIFRETFHHKIMRRWAKE